jgi:hypothetical protein
MTPDEFAASLADAAPPSGLSLALQGLWWDGRGDWARAHQCAQDQDDGVGAWVHGYLHRKEGDLGNAGYWYARAGRTMPQGALEDEWRAMVAALLKPF